MLYSAIRFFPFISVGVLAVNDWSIPCFQGQCSYDLPQTSDTSASGTLQIWGASYAISDITPAAGWTILDCDPNAISQDIRLVCTSGNTDTTGCGHLSYKIPPTDKIVRLPENCGKTAFARVAKVYVPEDQSLPPNIAARFARRDNTSSPQVKGLSLDSNFSSADPSATGNVGFSVQGLNVPGATGSGQIVNPRSRIYGRSLSSFLTNAISSFSSFNKNITTNLPPITFNKDIPILNSKISCPASSSGTSSSAAVTADVGANVNMVVQVGMAASGSLVPPAITDFAVYAGLNGKFDGTLKVTGSANGDVDSGVLTLFTAPIAGIDFPGVLTLGPTFKLNGQAKASLSVDIDMNVDLSYSVSNAQLFFPASTPDHPSGGNFAIGDSPLKISVDPSISATGTIEGHLIPTIDLGLSALGAADATVSLDLDASADLTMTLSGQADVSDTLNPRQDDGGDDGEVDSDDENDGNDDGEVVGGDGEDDGSDEDEGNTEDDEDNSSGVDGEDVSEVADDTEDEGSDGDDGEDVSDTSNTVDPEVAANGSDSDNEGSSDNSDVDDADTGDSSNSSDQEDGANSSEATSTADASDVTNTADDSDATSIGTAGASNATSTVDASDAINAPDSTDATNTVDAADAASTVSNATTNADSSNSTSTDTSDVTATADASNSTSAANAANSSSTSGVSTSASVNGCFDVGAAIDVNAAADGKFFSLFDESTKVNLFSQKFELFKKCIGSGSGGGSQAPSKRMVVHNHKLLKRGLTCPSSAAAALISAVDEALPASSIQTTS